MCTAHKQFKEIKFLVKHLGCTHNQLNLSIPVMAFAFSQQPFSLSLMGPITFALCFSFFPCTGCSVASRPIFAANGAESLLLFKHISVFPFFSLGLFFSVWPD